MAMIMSDSGHIIHAQAMYGLTYHLAWGDLPPGYGDPWSISQIPPLADSAVVVEIVMRGTTAGGRDQLAHTGIMYVVSVVQGTTVYNLGVDYNLTGSAIDWSPVGGHEPVANSEYTVIYRYNTTAITSLVRELGRRAVTMQSFVNLDPDGDIVANGTSWSLTANNGNTPSANMYLMFKFDSTDAIGSIIYQLGIFVGTVLIPGTPIGTKYLTQVQVLDPGKLYMAENVEPFSRFAGKREIFEFVITF
jgi:hypothetical protein